MTHFTRGGKLAADLRSDVEPLHPEEQAVLGAVCNAAPPAPDRTRLLATAYAATDYPKENNMLPNIVTRLFAGKNPALRAALGAGLLVALVALSLLLPRGGGLTPASPAWAASEGFLLAFDFGAQDLETVRPILNQLKAKVKAFKTAHGIPVGEQRTGAGIMATEHKMVQRITTSGSGASHEPGQQTEQQQQRVVAMVSLPDASLLDELKKELADIPGLPAPEVTDSTWFTDKGLPDPGQPGINLSLKFDDKQHVFNFPSGATAAQIEDEVNGWLAANKPDCKFTVHVTLSGDEKDQRIQVEIQGKRETTTPSAS